jgi:hypothetical protein
MIIVSTIVIISFGFVQDSFAITEAEIKEMLKENDSTTRPTFGLSHENNKKIVDRGFSFNNKTFTITDNFHTPFPEQSVTIGEINSFEAKVFAEHGLKVQEFIFGIPQKGDAHLGELAIEVWYDSFGEIQKLNVVQESDVIDAASIEAVHEKSNCTKRDSNQNCDTTQISMVFLESLQYDVMAIKAIDNLNRYQITYLNEGFDVIGDSLNEMPSMMIMSPIRNEGLIKITQEEKYSSKWLTKDGRIFEQNSFGSFKQIDQKFERFQDTGDIRTRTHSGFAGMIVNEEQKAIQIFDGSKLIKDLPTSFKTSDGDNKRKIGQKMMDRITPQLKAKMLEIEQECKKYLEDTYIQARW